MVDVDYYDADQLFHFILFFATESLKPMKLSFESYEQYWVAKVDTVIYVEAGVLGVIYDDTKHNLMEGSSIVIPQFHRVYLSTESCILHYIPLFDEKDEIEQTMTNAFCIDEE